MGRILKGARVAAPSIGVVTISYNQVRYLESAIRSVLEGRRGGPSEYVIVDAGSRDGSFDIIQRFRSSFSVVITEPDAGPADGLNKGFARCSSDILCYLNSDDEMVPGALEFAASFFEMNPDVDVLSGACEIIDEEGVPRWRRALSTTLSEFSIMAGTALVLQQATFFRRSAFLAGGGFNVSNKSCWDFECLVDMFLAGARHRAINKVLARFRIHEDSITGSQRMQDRYRDDRARIVAKVEAAGGRRPSKVSAWVARGASRCDPSRRLRELWIR
jgi:glycosyltransferase involved in cell wall biosynthesis